MTAVEKSITVRVPLDAAYAQWLQFEDFPIFMEGITDVWQLDDAHLRWRADIAGKKKEWDAEIIEQMPGRRIAWRSIGGVPNGAVSFYRLGDDATRILLQMEYDPHSIADSDGDAQQVFSRRIEGDLERCKELLEAQRYRTSTWRRAVRPQPSPQSKSARR